MWYNHKPFPILSEMGFVKQHQKSGLYRCKSSGRASADEDTSPCSSSNVVRKPEMNEVELFGFKQAAMAGIDFHSARKSTSCPQLIPNLNAVLSE